MTPPALATCNSSPISNANGHAGYVPTAAAFAEGGYEVEEAPRLLGGLPFRPEVEETTRRAMREHSR